jgi:peptide/nickel transport system substrate-binding protein
MTEWNNEMASVSKKSRYVLATAAALAMLATGCSGNGNSGGAGGAGNVITIGTTDKVLSLDPAVSWDTDSFAIMTQVYPFLMNSPYGSADVEPDIATSASFTAPTQYTVKLKPGLKFANGHDLTSSDVKFSFDRILKINDPIGPAALLHNLASVETPDETTVVFTLKTPNDQVWPQILSSPGGVIVDEEVFSPDSATPDQDIVKANAFGGQYVITSFDLNNLVSYKANPNYEGMMPKAKTSVIRVKFYTNASNLKLDVQAGNVDVAWRSLSPTDIASLRADKKVKIVDGTGGAIRFINFNFDTQPYGAKTPEADPAKALAVRQAVANLVDRNEIAKQVYQDTFKPLYSVIPDVMPGATTVLKDQYGDGNGGPDAAKAKAVLTAAGVTVPVKMNLQYNTDHYGPASVDEYGIVKDQLESSGLFKVNLQSTEWVQYVKNCTGDGCPVWQAGWFPDYSDADTYLQIYTAEGYNNIHYNDTAVFDLIKEQAITSDKAARLKLIEEIQAKIAEDVPTVPLLEGNQIAVTGTDVTGVKETLDASFKFRYASLAKK